MNGSGYLSGVTLLRLWVEERDGEYLYPLCVCLLLGLRFRLELGLASLLYMYKY